MEATVRELEPEENVAAAAVVARALRDAPTTLASYGDDPLERMWRTYNTFRGFFGELDMPQIGALVGACPIGIAVVAEPGHCVGSLFGAYATETLAKPVPEYGDPAREQIFWANWAERDLPEDHWHIGPVGVEPGFQGRGVGGAIMRRLCEDLDRSDRVAWLETDKEANVRFYSALGFKVVDSSPILEVPTWYMRRDPPKS